MDAITTDWLHEQQQDEWRRRIRQLHRELSEQRMQLQKPQLMPEGVADKDADLSTKLRRRLKSSEHSV